MQGSSGERNGASRVSDVGLGGGLERRSVLRALGGAVALGATPAVVRGEPVRGVRSGGRPLQAGGDDSDGVRWVPTWGGCDAVRGETECGDGLTGVYDDTGWGGRIGLGAHTYQIRVQGLPWPTFEGLLAGSGPRIVGIPFLRLPPPPAGDLEYGPYDLVVNGVQIDIDVVEDRAAPQRLVHGDCEVPPACRERWCDVVDRTVDAIGESSERLRLALLDVRRSIETRSFRVTVPRRVSEPAAMYRLGTRILTALRTEIAILRGEMAGNRPTVDVGDVCEGCPPCVEAPRVRTVRSWELRLSERSRATAALDDVDSWAHHELDAVVRLDPARSAGSRRLGESEGDGPLGGILSGIARLFEGLGGLLGGSPDEWMGRPVDATAWQSSGYTATTDDGAFSVVNTATGAYSGGEPDADVGPNELSDFSQLGLHADDEYELGFPQLPVTGTSVVSGLPNGGSSPVEDSVGYGAEIVRRARAGDGDSGASDRSTFRFPLGDTENCGSRLSGGVEVDLTDGGLVPATYTSVAGVSGSGGQATGRASVTWELVPLSHGSGDRRVVGCR